MRVEKSPVNSHRIRKIPSGFGWVDHRIVRDKLIKNCSTDALALYLLLICVSDQDGLSFYGDTLLCSILGWSKQRLEAARNCLTAGDLLAWATPIYQVLEIASKNGVGDYD